MKFEKAAGSSRYIITNKDVHVGMVSKDADCGLWTAYNVYGRSIYTFSDTRKGATTELLRKLRYKERRQSA